METSVTAGTSRRWPWLPERHLARFVVEVIEQLDLSAFVKAYRGSGSASYHPSMLLGLPDFVVQRPPISC